MRIMTVWEGGWSASMTYIAIELLKHLSTIAKTHGLEAGTIYSHLLRRLGSIWDDFASV